jgi:hypothetical protein
MPRMSEKKIAEEAERPPVKGAWPHGVYSPADLESYVSEFYRSKGDSDIFPSPIPPVYRTGGHCQLCSMRGAGFYHAVVLVNPERPKNKGGREVCSVCAHFGEHGEVPADIRQDVKEWGAALEAEGVEIEEEDSDQA